MVNPIVKVGLKIAEEAPGFFWIAGCGNGGGESQPGPTSGGAPTTPTSPTADAGATPETPPTPTETTPPLERTRYVPPEEPFFPTATSDGVFFHSVVPPQGSYPLLKLFRDAQETQQKHYFYSIDNKVSSFPTKNFENAPHHLVSNLANNEDLPIREFVNFFPTQNPGSVGPPDMNQPAPRLADFAIWDNNFYGLYNENNPNLPPVGVAIRNHFGDGLETFVFPAMDPPLSNAQQTVPYDRTLLVSVSNYVFARDDYSPGKVFFISQNRGGTLGTKDENGNGVMPPSITTTQFNPQAFAVWKSSSDKDYILVVNTGKTPYNPDKVVPESERQSGVDVIDPETQKIVANIPLGEAAANTIICTEDGLLCFLGNQGTPPQFYVLDMDWLGKRLGELDTNVETVTSLPDVPLADAGNAVSLVYPELGFIAAMDYDDVSHTLLVSAFNGRLLQITADYQPTGVAGVHLNPGFGRIVRHYVCAGENTEGCGGIALLEEGALALTGNPMRVTFYPNDVLGR